jgi:branched-chain amino acid transport system substrate-binding protein
MKRQKQEKVFALNSCVISMVLACTGAPTWAADASPVLVKIGHVGPLTGQVAHMGKDSENGARLAIDEINKGGLTIAGKRISLVLDTQDDGADPRTGTAAATKLVDDGVVAVIGHINSGVSIPAARIYSDAGVTQISPASTNPAYTQQGYMTTYRVIATDAQQGPALADFAVKKLKAGKIAVVDDATAYGQGLANQFVKSALANGAQITSRDATNDKAVDFRAILTRIKGLQPDLIMFGGSDATVGPFARQAKSLGIPAKIIGGDGACHDKVVELAGDAADNIICSEAGLSLAQMPRGRDFQERYVARYNSPVQQYSPFAYDAVYIAVAAMKKADSVDPRKITAAMRATNYDGVIGNIQFDEKGDLKKPVITIYEFSGGKKRTLDIIRL